MRLYTDPLHAMKETERDLWEMGIEVFPHSMQDKVIAGDESYSTKEMQGYTFKIQPWDWKHPKVIETLGYFFPNEDADKLYEYILQEVVDRISGEQLNPGNSYKLREDVWKGFLNDSRHGDPAFHYTYSERIAVQLPVILEQLRTNPDTRQAILNIHSNISAGQHQGSMDGRPVFHHSADGYVAASHDLNNIGGHGRIPCSMYYQFMRRNDQLDLIYTMRSCDLLTHFPIDILIALQMKSQVAAAIECEPGSLTYFCGSLHAYRKDMKVRGIF